MRTIIGVAVALAIGIPSMQTSYASNCMHRTVELIFAEADAVFTGVVEEDNRVRVTDAFKGVTVGERVPTRGGFSGTVGQCRTYAAYKQDDGVVRIITGPSSRAYFCESPLLERQIAALRRLAGHR
jgi:hypothetical protein